MISYSYDANGNITSVTPPGRMAHLFTYTPVNLEESYTPPLADPTTAYAYNLDRQISSITRAGGQTITFQYDTGGRLQAVTASSSNPSFTETRTYTYNPTTGHLESLGLPDVALSFTYDGFLQLTQTWSGVVNGTVGRTYNNDFRVVALQTNAEAAIPFAYDGDGLLTQVGAMAITFPLV